MDLSQIPPEEARKILSAAKAYAKATSARRRGRRSICDPTQPSRRGVCVSVFVVLIRGPGDKGRGAAGRAPIDPPL